MLPESDRIRIQHMLDAGYEAREFLADYSAEDLAQDRMRALSIVKCIEIIGEAASSISPETKALADAYSLARHCCHAQSASTRLF